jgi:hypothetical protein
MGDIFFGLATDVCCTPRRHPSACQSAYGKHKCDPARSKTSELMETKPGTRQYIAKLSTCAKVGFDDMIGRRPGDMVTCRTSVTTLAFFLIHAYNLDEASDTTVVDENDVFL